MSDDGGGGGGDSGGGDSGGCDSGGGYDGGGSDNNYSYSAQADNDYSGIGSTASALESALEAVHQIESTKDVISSSDTAGQYQDSNEPSRNDYNPLYYNDSYHRSPYVSNYTPWREVVRDQGRRRDEVGSDSIFKLVIGITIGVIVLFIVLIMNSK